MSTYHLGPLGDFSGKIGAVVGATWRGQPVMRSMPNKTTKAPTPAQLHQRDKFAAVINFLNPLKELLNVTFGDNTQVKTPFNNATSYHLKAAVRYEDDRWQMVYPKVLISLGTLQGLQTPVVSLMPSTSLLLQWTDNSTQGNANPDDQLVLVVYAPERKQYDYYTEDATRQDGSVHVALPTDLQGQRIEVWASFITASGDNAAVSMYLGSYMVV